MKPKIGIPRLGMYNDCLKNLFKELGCEVIDCPPVTKKTSQIGCRHINELFCYPAKVVLGSMVELLDKGAEEIVMYVTQNPMCRFQTYPILQKQILEDLGYDFKMHHLTLGSLLKDIKKVCGRSKWKIMFQLYKTYKEIKEIENKRKQELEHGDIKIGVIGETYCMWEDKVNMYLFDKLKSHGAAVFNSFYITDFCKSEFEDLFKHGQIKKKSKKYLPIKDFPGHAKHSIENT
ncbi:unnamed protein product, partial [marine sediment metagenome]